MQENFKEFRNKEAGKLREIRKIDKVAAEAFLQKLEETEEYKTAKDLHSQERISEKESKVETESVKESKEVKQDMLVNLESNLPEGFEVSKSPDGKIEIILQDQNNFDGWNNILSEIKDGILNTIKLYDFEGKDNVYIEIKEPVIAKEQSGEESLAIRFNQKDINKDNFNYLKNSDAVATSHIMTILPKNKMLICHKGMVRSIAL